MITLLSILEVSRLVSNLSHKNGIKFLGRIFIIIICRSITGTHAMTLIHVVLCIPSKQGNPGLKLVLKKTLSSNKHKERNTAVNLMTVRNDKLDHCDD
jgi:hypothetical protein